MRDRVAVGLFTTVAVAWTITVLWAAVEVSGLLFRLLGVLLGGADV